MEKAEKKVNRQTIFSCAFLIINVILLLFKEKIQADLYVVLRILTAAVLLIDMIPRKWKKADRSSLDSFELCMQIILTGYLIFKGLRLYTGDLYISSGGIFPPEVDLILAKWAYSDEIFWIVLMLTVTNNL